MRIDTHCHYNLDPLYQDWRHHWQTAQDKGVTHSIVVGTGVETSHNAAELAALEQGLFFSAGIHPTQVTKWVQTESDPKHQLDQELRALRKLVEQNSKKLVAVGEVGLDYYRVAADDPQFAAIQKLQHLALQSQIELAQSFDLPIILHIRDKQTTAYKESYDVLKQVNRSQLILHCFSGSDEFLKQMEQLGAFFGVDGNITYPNTGGERPQRQAQPPSQVLRETDAPERTPQQQRGPTCQPWMVTLTEQYLVSELGFSADSLADNATRAFPKLTTG